MGNSSLISIARRQFMLLMLLVCLPLAVAAGELAGPQQVIQRISDQLQQVLMNNQQQLQDDPVLLYQLANEVLVPYIDFGHVSNLVLGKYWRRATEEQKQDFSRQFQRLLVRTYSTAFKEFQGWEISYTPLRMNEGDNDVAVYTQVKRTGAPPVDVVYRMHIKDGDWKAYDVKIEGISLVTNYRTSFAKEVRRSGMRGLIERITELNNSRVKRVGTNSST